MSIELPPLPWAADGLQPYISAETIQYHYGKHHRAYVDKVNAMIKGTDLEGRNLEHVITETAGNPELQAVYDNAAQAWNHTFFWNSMKPRGGVPPKGVLEGKIVASFGTYEEFKRAFANKATALFGSGWVWLVLDGDKLEILQTSNAENPITMARVPLLTLDVWEHAYYLDYRNRRGEFVDAYLERLMNWDFAALNLAKTGEKAVEPPYPAVGDHEHRGIR